MNEFLDRAKAITSDPMAMCTESYLEEMIVSVQKMAQESGYEAGRESVIANRETYQKVKAEGVREGMERAKAIALHTHRDREYTRTAYEAADEIQKEIDNDYPD